MSNPVDQIWPGGIPRVGQVAERSRTVSAKDIERFTEISGDRNPLHYDEAVAKASRFGEIVVQGGITSAILNAVVRWNVITDRPTTSKSTIVAATGISLARRLTWHVESDWD